MDSNKFTDKYYSKDDKTGFNSVIEERQKKLEALRIRLKNLYLEDFEIENLFKIIVNAEIKMEKIKASINYKNATTQELEMLQLKLIGEQDKMKKDFDEKLNKILKEKYEKAKEILAKKQKNNPDTK